MSKVSVHILYIIGDILILELFDVELIITTLQSFEWFNV